jgi:hypothetical protein
MLSRDTGHSRVPAPPHIKTGISKALITGLSHTPGGRASGACTGLPSRIFDGLQVEDNRRKGRGQARSLD